MPKNQTPVILPDFIRFYKISVFVVRVPQLIKTASYLK